MKRKSTKKVRPFGKSLFLWVGIFFGIVFMGFLGYSALEYQHSQQEQEGFFVCSKGGKTCEVSTHVHADVSMQVCDKEIYFPKEKGRTDKQHTHKEQNMIHWHARVSVDPVSRKPLDISDLTIAAFLDQMEYDFPQTCGENNGPVLEVMINDKIVPEKLKTTWSNGDKIDISYK